MYQEHNLMNMLVGILLEPIINKLEYISSDKYFLFTSIKCRSE